MESVSDIISQVNCLKVLKKLGTSIRYTRPSDSKRHTLSIVVFSDASRSNECGQIGFVAGLLIGDFEKDSIYHVLHWSSNKSRCPVKSIGAAEILAAGNAVDEAKMLAAAYTALLHVKIDVVVCVDCKDLYDSLSTCHRSADKSIRADVAVIMYEFETHNINRMIWIPGKINPADPLTKRDSPMNKALQLMLYNGLLCENFDQACVRSSNKVLG